MGRLAGRGLPGRIAAAPSRLAPPPKDERRAASNPLRHLYSTARWARLRKKIFKRDKHKCQATGVGLVGGRKHPHAAVCDHIVPHRGDLALFWDENNLQSVCKEWHDREKQRLEKRGFV